MSDITYDGSIQEATEQFNQIVANHIAFKVECVAKGYAETLEEKDREILGLREAIKQSAKDFAAMKLHLEKELSFCLARIPAYEANVQRWMEDAAWCNNRMRELEKLHKDMDDYGPEAH